jgi:hypothetical protein
MKQQQSFKLRCHNKNNRKIVFQQSITLLYF